MANLGNLLYQIGADVKGLRSAVDEVNKATKKMDDDFNRVDKSSKDLGSTWGMLKGAAAAMGIGALARDLLQTAMALDTMNNKLRFSVGSATLAVSAYKMIRAESDRLGLGVMTAADAFGSFATAAKGTSLEGGATKEIFLSVAEASTVMGLSNEQAAGAMLALSQIMSKGKVQAEELRGQLGERIPGAFQIAARAMDMTTAELDKFMADGNLTATIFLPKFASQMRKEMAGSVGESAQSTRANLNRLENAWLDLKRSMLDTGFLGIISSSLKTLTSALELATRAMERDSEVRRKASKGTVGDQSADAMRRHYFGVLGIPTEQKRGSLSGADYSSYNDLSASESAFAQGMSDLSKMAEENIGKLKAKAKELREEAVTSYEEYRKKVREVQETLDAGLMSAGQAETLFAKAWQEYYKEYPTQKIQEEIKLLQESGKIKLEALEQEKNTLEANHQMGRVDTSRYYQDINRITQQMADQRISILQQEKERTKEMMGVDLQNPTKTGMDKDILKNQYQSRLMSIDAEIMAQQTERGKAGHQIMMEQMSDVRKLVDLEVSALQEILSAFSGNFEERLSLAEDYLKKRREQIELEKQANLRTGMNPELADYLSKVQSSKAGRDAYVDPYIQQATLAQLRNEYAQLTGTMAEQLTTQKALAVAAGERNAAENKLPEIKELYRQIAQEQAKLLELRKSGSFGEGFAYEMDKVGKSLPTTFDQGRESVNQLKSAIDSASGSLADMFVGRKVDASQFFQQIIRDMIKVQIQGMLMKSVFGEGSGGGFLGGAFGGIGSIIGGLFGGGSAGFADIGGEMAYPNALASGGDAVAGHLYEVNEKGTEWFQPKVSGTVIPLSSSPKPGDGASAPNVVVAPNFRIEIVNNGDPIGKAQEGPTRQEGDEYIKSVHINALKNDPDYLAAHQAYTGRGRR